MKTKKITLLIVSFLLIGIVASFGVVSADRELINLGEINIDDFTAGTEVQANFSYDYLGGVAENVDDSPLIIQLNISSEDEINYPVWRGDFEIEGHIERCQWTILGSCFFEKKIHFKCSEASEQTIVHPLGSEPLIAKNGTFYCYNHTADLDLDRQDNVFLNIMSEPALWPGDYTLNAKMFYLNDTYNPKVQIVNKNEFEGIYYKSGNNIEVKAEIFDVNIDEIETIGKIYWEENEIKLNKNYEGEIYSFSETLPEEIPEGNHTIEIFAKDLFGNYAVDQTRLLIDETPPEIELLNPVEESEVYSDILEVEVRVEDEKAGVDKDSVELKLREIINGQICPITGGYLGNNETPCTTTDWISLEFNETSETFKKEIDTIELNLSSGEYWLDIRAKDILGNEAYFGE